MYVKKFQLSAANFNNYQLCERNQKHARTQSASRTKSETTINMKSVSLNTEQEFTGDNLFGNKYPS